MTCSDCPEEKCRHILSLSGGKDSTALALYMKDRVPDMEYVFCDTGEELPETYEYLLKLEAHLGKQVVRLNPDRPFQYYLHLWGGVLPDVRMRWCTKMLKLRPFERYVGEKPVQLYVGIRFDEKDRQGYISSKPNISSRFPFIEDGIEREDVLRILSSSGLGLAQYYSWRSRSGCYFCFFQQKREWVGLLENHEDLFWQAAAFEKEDRATGARFTWNQNESLRELAAPQRILAIKRDYEKRLAEEAKRSRRDGTLRGVLCGEEDFPSACNICRL